MNTKSNYNELHSFFNLKDSDNCTVVLPVGGKGDKIIRLFHRKTNSGGGECSSFATAKLRRCLCDYYSKIPNIDYRLF